MNLAAYSLDDLLLKRRGLCRRLSAVPGLHALKIAVLGGSTTNELVDLLELHLLASGFQPTFLQSEYGRFFEDAVLDPQALLSFKPDIVYIHTSNRNVQMVPSINSSEEDFATHVEQEFGRYKQIWQSLDQHLDCQIIQNNFELPALATLGNLDGAVSGGLSRFLLALNERFASASRMNPRLMLQDIHNIAATIGLANWFDQDRWFSYKIPFRVEANLLLARSLTSMVRALYGRSRKVLVLDLDNTLWGGVIGDDGADKIQIGRETPLAEAYTAFQEYCLSLRKRGILLAVCSKNNEEIARSGFDHPDSILKIEHFSCFKANWKPKNENLQAIAAELNLGTDSFVFVDDNPAERSIVLAQLPEVAVPDIGSNPSHYAAMIEAGRYFEPVSLSQEDLARAALYGTNAARGLAEAKFADYGEYLASLEMTAEIATFEPVYLERIAQLTNKTNQFNLTTRRYTLAEIERIARSSDYIALYGKLSDRFGDNGLVSVVLGRRDVDTLHLELWLMSCRVLKRDMEAAMLDELVARASAAGIHTLLGYYAPTKKNGIVAQHYSALGFKAVSENDGTSVWALNIHEYSPLNRHIKTHEFANA